MTVLARALVALAVAALAGVLGVDLIDHDHAGYVIAVVSFGFWAIESIADFSPAPHREVDDESESKPDPSASGTGESRTS